MKNYSKTERKIAGFLDKFPKVKKTLKNIYQRINYLIHKKKNFKFDLNKDAKIISLNDLTGNNNSTFFGYYDKSPWSPNMQYYLFHEINGNKLELYYMDLISKQKKFIDSTNAWNYQQGAMLQWLNNEEIIYNFIDNGQLVSKCYNLKEKKVKQFNAPLQTISQSEDFFITLNYKRLNKLRKQYGYKYKVINYTHKTPLDQDGIFRLNFEENKSELIVSIEELLELLELTNYNNNKVKVNHIMLSPDSRKMIYMLRWFAFDGKHSALIVSDASGKNHKVLLNEKMVSHYSWLNNNEIIVWGRTKLSGDQYYKIDVTSEKKEIIGENILNLFGDGHPTISPNKKWIITDTYPDKSRIRHLILFNIETNEKIILGSFFAPFKFNWDTRVDLHPRWSPDGNYISIDSSHENKRRNYIIDVSNLISQKENR